MGRHWRERLSDRVARLDRRAPASKQQAAREDFETEREDRRRREAAGTSIHELGVSHVRFALWRADIATVEELTQRTAAEVLAIPEIGPRRLVGIREELARRGLALSGEEV